MKRIPFLLLAACSLIAAAPSMSAQTLVGLGAGGASVSTYSAPGATPTSYAITGTTGSEAIIGIDFFSSSATPNQLYGMGASGTLYTLSQSGATYAAIVNSTASAVPGATVIDFNPVASRLRVFAGTGNFRLTPGVGGAITSDGTLAYNSGDVSFGLTPALGGAAYINNTAGATATSLYSVDTTQDTLVLHTGTPQFNGLSTVATLTLSGVRFDITAGTTGFDIFGGSTNTAYLSKGNALYSVNLANGILTSLGTQLGGPIIDLAVPEPSTYAMFAISGLVFGIMIARRTRRTA